MLLISGSDVVSVRNISSVKQLLANIVTFCQIRNVGTVSLYLQTPKNIFSLVLLNFGGGLSPP